MSAIGFLLVTLGKFWMLVLLRFFLAIALVFSLVGCVTSITPRHSLIYSQTDASVANVHEIFVASTRVRDDDGNILGSLQAQRSMSVSYFQYGVSVPKNSKLGAVAWPISARTNPATDFLTVSDKRFDYKNNFLNAMGGHARNNHNSNKDALVFVHGFNTNFAESLYHVAQMDRDFKVPGIKVLYDWPSAGHPLLYAHDLDSQLFARTGLANTLDDMARSDISGIILVAYSSGGELALEALRELKLSRKSALFRKLKGVILVSPDVDVDVFKSTAAIIGDLPQPFFIFAAQKDSVMEMFAPLWGNKVRLAHVTDYDTLAEYKITFIDPGASKDNGNLNHMSVLGSPTFIKLINSMSGSNLIAFGNDAKSGMISGSTLTQTGEVTRVVLPAEID